MKYLDPMPADVRTEIRKSINEHAERLREILKSSASHAKEYLTFTNAGAAVALTAFMGSSAGVRASPFSWISLCLFALGLIAAGVLAALDYHGRATDFHLWLSDSNQFFGNQIEIEALYERLNSRSARFERRAVIAGYVAFACFIAGAGLSAGHFLASSIHPKQGPYEMAGSAPWCILYDHAPFLMVCDYYTELHCERSGLPDDKSSFCVPRPQ